MDEWKLPDTGYLRLKQIMKPHEVYPDCRSKWYARVAQGIYPTPVRLSPRTVVWRIKDIGSRSLER
jgi:prophage regulatory protein